VIGVPDYSMTAAVWIRGILQDEYGVRAADVKWRSGGLEQPGREARVALELPAGIELKAIPVGETLSQQLDNGRIDGLISALAPSCLGRNPAVRRLFPDYRTVEEAYFERTRMFPIMHLVGIRRSLLEEHPWLAVNTYVAYLKAKEICYRQLETIGHLFTTLPWPVDELSRARGLMGEDFWSYGVEANRRELAAVSRYAFEQGIIDRQLTVEDLFAPSTLSLSKV
jgi:4,5-dihydroxyphthalate decarboxylase